MLLDRTSLLAISTLTSEINFYTRLIKMRDSSTGKQIFCTLNIELACQSCKESGKSSECVHLLHLAPRWQSTERHRRLKKIMEDRPDLIQSELAGLAFDSLQQAFAQADVDRMFAQQPPDPVFGQPVFIVIDPAAGGPSSDYAVVSITSERGQVTVIGVEILSGCKDPTKQFQLVREHVARLRMSANWAFSDIVILVERNLGFEAEHHSRELGNMENVAFYCEPGSDRVGAVTTNETKHAMCAMLNAMLREGRISVKDPLISREPAPLRVKLKEQLGIYSYQFKAAANTFGKDAVALSCKVGGMKDDIAICLQLAVLYTSPRK